MTRPAFRRDRGFSLGELLIVIGIIGILAALLFPVFVKARESAYQTSAVSNIRQVGVAQLLYLTDYDDVIVPYFCGFDPGTGLYTDPQAYWPQLVSVYVQSLGKLHGYHGQALDTDLPKIFFDPILPLSPQPEGAFGYITSWGIADDIVDWVGPTGYMPSRRPASMAELSQPADTYLDVETRDYFWNGIYPGDALALAPRSDYSGINAAYSTAGHYFGSDDFTHIPATGRSLMVYCDGHAKSLPASKVATEQYGWFRQQPGVWP